MNKYNLFGLNIFHTGLAVSVHIQKLSGNIPYCMYYLYSVVQYRTVFSRQYVVRYVCSMAACWPHSHIRNCSWKLVLLNYTMLYTKPYTTRTGHSAGDYIVEYGVHQTGTVFPSFYNYALHYIADSSVCSTEYTAWFRLYTLHYCVE